MMTDHEMLMSMYEHFLTWNKEFGAIQANVEMLTRFFYIVMTASIGSAVASVWSLIEHRRYRNGRK
jgi:hypothetical protein